MSKILSFILLVPLAIVLIAFCVVNRGAATLSLDPFGTIPQLAISAPLFVLLFGALMVGLLLGGFGTFLTQAHYRHKAARRAREIETLRHEVDLGQDRLRRLREEREKALLPPPAPSGASVGAIAGPA